jgi:3-hydroxyisobutyrate dehydrogenase
MKIAFTGLGDMGPRIARNLLVNGHELVVNDLRKEAADQNIALRAEWAESAAEAVAAADVLITMRPGPKQIQSVMLSAGAAEVLRPGGTWIDMSTPTLEAVRQVDGIALRVPEVIALVA